MKKFLLATAIAIGLSSAALANPVLTDLTTDDYIVLGNLKWAAASPVTQQYFYGYELFTADLHAGWREATDAEWASRPNWDDFAGKCASKYWNSSFTHCDVGDALSQHFVAGDGSDYRDLWYVSSVAADGTVPEPATLGLFGLGLFGAFAARRKANRK